MRLPSKITQSTDVDQYTGELFSSYTSVGPDLTFKGLVDLAEDFMETISFHFEGISSDHTAEDYANWYIDNNRMDWE